MLDTVRRAVLVLRLLRVRNDDKPPTACFRCDGLQDASGTGHVFLQDVLPGLVELYSRNSDGTTLTIEQLKSWVAQTRSGETVTPIPSPQSHAIAGRLGGVACAVIMRRYQEGESAQKLAEEYGVARNAILNLLRKNNVMVRRQPLIEAQKDPIAKEYEAWLTIAALAKKHASSHGVIGRLLHDAGITGRARGGSCARKP